MPRFLLILALSAVASVAIYLPACHSKDAAQDPAPAAVDNQPAKPPSDIQMFEATTPAALLALLAATPTTDPTRAASLTWTGDGEEVPSSPILCLEWDIPQVGRLRPPAAPAEDRAILGQLAPEVGGAVGLRPAGGWLAPGTSPGLAWLRSPEASEGWRALRSLVGPPREARADLGPLSGVAYLLTLSIPDNDKLLRVFTTDKQFDPSTEDWAKLQAARTTIKVVLLTATFDHDKITPDGGPFASKPILFTIAP
jgi:hypothetical protein